MISPLVGVGVVNALLFGVYGYFLELQSGNENSVPSLTHTFWAGCGSGFVNSFVSAPVELVKIQLQNQVKKEIKSPWDCILKIYGKSGVRGLFRGLPATILRETPSYGVYFCSFEFFCRIISGGTDTSKISSLNLIFAGGFSGMLGWLSSYPFDVVKTRIQNQNLTNFHLPQYKSTLHCTTDLIRANGVQILFRGLSATMIRAFPTNAVIFLTYKSCKEHLEKINEKFY